MSGGSWVCCMPCYWLRTNSSLHKASLTVVTLLVTSLLVASPVLFLISSVPANEQPYKDCSTSDDEECFGEKIQDNPTPLCDSLECKEIARRMQFSISWDHDPCRDFYKFACGGWVEAQKAKSRRPRPTLGMDLSFTTVQTTVHLQIQRLLSLNATSGRYKKLGAFYTSCLMSFNKPVDMSPMYMMLDKLGGYLPPGSLGPNDITPLVASILKVSGAPLFDISMAKDRQNKTRYSIIISVPRDASGYRSFVSDDLYQGSNWGGMKYQSWNQRRYTSSRSRRDIQKQSVFYKFLKEKRLEKQLVNLEKVVMGMLPKKMPAKEKALDIRQILLFATTADKLIPRRKELRELMLDPANHEPYTLESLQETFPFITWNTLFKEIWPTKWTTDNKVNIYVISKPYLHSVSEMMSLFQKRVIQNALLALYARDYLYRISDHSLLADDKYQFCSHFTTSLFDQTVSALYLSQFSQQYLQETKEKVSRMFLELKRSLLLRVEKASWLPAPARTAALVKLQAMTGSFLAWPALHNKTFQDELLRALTITDDFFENVVTRYQEMREIQLDVINQPTVDHAWPHPYLVNAYYDQDDNIVMVPMALLTQIQFSGNIPAYMSYGTVGNVLAHEMMHALDAVSPGMATPAWASTPVMTQKLSCLVDHYRASAKRSFKFKADDLRVDFDGNATREENAADVGGVRVAWGAWRALGAAAGGASLPPLPLAPAKLFFLSLAQLYCGDLTAEEYFIAVENDFHMTAPERVNGLFRNSMPFSEVFQCAAGSPMNPPNKCVLW